MKIRSVLRLALILLSAGTIAAGICSPIRAQQKTAAKTVMAKILVTVMAEKDRNPPEIQKEDVIVRVNKERMKVTHWEAAKGQYGGVALFIVIDDVLDPTTGGLFSELKDFIKAQPPTSLIAIGYMRNGGVQIAQDLTNDHEKAANAVRLPTGNLGTTGSPYLSVEELIKRWPNHGGRKEILMLTDGIDRMQRPLSRMEAMTTSTYVDSASSAAQRAGIPVYSIYATGVGHATRNAWLAQGGQNSMAKLAEETGAEMFSLGFSNPVNLKPYLDDFQKILNNQYWLAFDAPGEDKPKLKPIKITTEVRGVEIISADSVLIPAAK